MLIKLWRESRVCMGRDKVIKGKGKGKELIYSMKRTKWGRDLKSNKRTKVNEKR